MLIDAKGKQRVETWQLAIHYFEWMRSKLMNKNNCLIQYFNFYIFSLEEDIFLENLKR